ncbi:hypothetical protein V6N13_059404 [Hibiscus sabdariffa]
MVNDTLIDGKKVKVSKARFPRNHSQFSPSSRANGESKQKPNVSVMEDKTKKVTSGNREGHMDGRSYKDVLIGKRMGVPLQCWYKEFFINLDKWWGKFVSFHDYMNKVDLSVAIMIIGAPSQFDIPREVKVKVNGRSYLIEIRVGEFFPEVLESNEDIRGKTTLRMCGRSNAILDNPVVVGPNEQEKFPSSGGLDARLPSSNYLGLRGFGSGPLNRDELLISIQKTQNLDDLENVIIEDSIESIHEHIPAQELFEIVPDSYEECPPSKVPGCSSGIRYEQNQVFSPQSRMGISNWGRNNVDFFKARNIRLLRRKIRDALDDSMKISNAANSSSSDKSEHLSYIEEALAVCGVSNVLGISFIGGKQALVGKVADLERVSC